MSEYDRIHEAREHLRSLLPEIPATAIVLGSGLGGVADALDNAIVVPYGRIPHWPAARVEGHDGQLVRGSLDGVPLLALAGRVHAYEGIGIETVVFGIRVLAQIGVRVVVITNASGAVNPQLAAGTLVIVDDHLNLTGRNPLVGPIDDRFGPSFVDMSEVYSKRLIDLADAAGKEASLPLAHGIYAGVLGPSYETPAEVRYLRTIGADIVGMSTVLEAIAARHAGLEVLAVSCVSNAAAGVLPVPVSHSEVLEAMQHAAPHVLTLLRGILRRL